MVAKTACRAAHFGWETFAQIARANGRQGPAECPWMINDPGKAVCRQVCRRDDAWSVLRFLSS
jgi:hypothetical protein